MTAKEIDIFGNRRLVYTDDAMQRVIDDATLFAPTDRPVLITGENGSGKENIARLIHQNSTCKDHPFIAVNCAAIPSTLMESELFGHEKGAFTGAHVQKQGLFELAKDGTLFLDEIGEMSPELQVKLLRVLQEGEFKRVGGHQTLFARPRIISATNKNIQAALKEGKLREDLYHRLSGAEIDVPALQRRPADIAVLATHIAAKTAAAYGYNVPGFSPEALEALQAYPWPGNVRELENRVSEAVIRAHKGGTILPAHLRLSPHEEVLAEKPTRTTALEDTFGYKLCMHREARGWTQTRLAERVSDRAKRALTAEVVADWEASRSVPDHDTLNALAYLLIINTDKTEMEKQGALEDFLTAAQTAMGMQRTVRGKPSFSRLLMDLRETARLTQTDLAARVTDINASVNLRLRDIYQLECGDPDRTLTPNEALAIVAALDSVTQLSPAEKLEFYNDAKSLFEKAKPAPASNGQPHGLNGASRNGAVVKKPATSVAEQCRRLKAFFVEGGKPDFEVVFALDAIAVEARIDHAIIYSLMGRTGSRVVTADMTDGVRDSLCDLLRKHGKVDAVIESFRSEFDNMRLIANYNPPANVRYV